jgi:hypothetical protein
MARVVRDAAYSRKEFLLTSEFVAEGSVNEGSIFEESNFVNCAFDRSHFR